MIVQVVLTWILTGFMRPGTATWTRLPSLPIEMGEVSAGMLVAGEREYLVVVGEHPRGASADDEGATMLYDVEERIWHQGAARPFPGNHHAAEVYNNKLYLFGGLTEGAGHVQVGDLVLDSGQPDMQWTALHEMDFASGSGISARIGDEVYYCGGINEANTRTLRECAVFNLETEEWSSIEPMPKGRNHAATCTDGSNIYVFGGRSGKNTVGEGFADTQIYTPGSGWRQGSALPLARGGMGKAVFYEDKCYVFGGEVDEDGLGTGVNDLRTVDRVDVYDVKNDNWSTGEDMPDGLHGIFPILRGKQVFIAAGGTKAAYSQSAAFWRLSLD